MAVIDRRIGVLFVGFVALLMIAVLRAGYLGTIKAGQLKADAAAQQVSTMPVPAVRGAIYDASGTDLAVTQTADDVIADPFLLNGAAKQSAAQQLAPLLGVPTSKVLAILSEHRGFAYLAHALPTAAAKAIMRLKIAGISLVPQVTREYPQGSAAAQVVGLVNGADQGFTGVEGRYNKLLGGTSGVRRTVYDAKGQPISIDDLHPARSGTSVTLTLDSAIQAEVEHVLAGVGATYAPKGATAIVMNPNTGAILALANWPAVNPNSVTGAHAGNLTNADLVDLEDRAVQFNYEPGSTFKAITVAGALQDGDITPQTPFNVPPFLQVYTQKIHDADPHGQETLSVSQIIQRSSNIGADEIAMNKLGQSRFNYWVHRFGFGSPTGVDLPGEAPGVVPRYPSGWSGTTIATLPFGQGLEVTPMQIASAYAAIANGGLLRTPHIVGSVGGHAVAQPKARRILSPQVASQMRTMLRGVYLDGGTAQATAIPGFDLAGKTGTANVVVDGTYSKSAYIASFVGFVPASAPKLEVMVMVDEPSRGSIYGGQVAAPAFSQIVGWAVPYLGIDPCPAPCTAAPTSVNSTATTSPVTSSTTTGTATGATPVGP